MSGVPTGLEILGEDLLLLLVRHITESRRPARTILRTLSALDRTSKAVHGSIFGRLSELRGLPVDVWESTSRSIPAQLTWTIPRFNDLDQERIYSPPFRHGPHTWRLLLFPGGDDVERNRPGASPHLSLYVDVADAAMLPYGWVREAHFLISVPSRRRPSKTIVRYARHDFEATARDWGFRELVPLQDLDEGGPCLYLNDKALTLHVKVWGVTDTMRAAERAQQLLRGTRVVGASSAVGASTASSTSMGSDDLGARMVRLRMGGTALVATLRERISSLFSRHRQRRRRNLQYRDLNASTPNVP